MKAVTLSAILDIHALLLNVKPGPQFTCLRWCCSPPQLRLCLAFTICEEGSFLGLTMYRRWIGASLGQTYLSGHLECRPQPSWLPLSYHFRDWLSPFYSGRLLIWMVSVYVWHLEIILFYCSLNCCFTAGMHSSNHSKGDFYSFLTQKRPTAAKGLPRMEPAKNGCQKMVPATKWQTGCYGYSSVY